MELNIRNVSSALKKVVGALSIMDAWDKQTPAYTRKKRDSTQLTNGSNRFQPFTNPVVPDEHKIAAI